MKLKDYLDRENMSQTKFAEKVGCKVSHINQIIHGRKNPSIPMMIKIMKATNDRVKPNDFAREE